MVELMKLATAESNAVLRPAENLDMVFATVVTGLIVVFCILVILVVLLSVMGLIMKKVNNKKKKEAPAPAPAAAVPVKAAAPEPEVIEEEEDDGELIAVISAAVAAYGEAEGKQYRVIGVRKKEKALRSGWSSAGIAENTRPF